MRFWKKGWAAIVSMVCVINIPISSVQGELVQSLIMPLTAEAEVYENMTYDVLADGTLEIIDCAADVFGVLTIPAEIDGTAVTKIGESAFRDCMGLQRIVIPASVTNIAEAAFMGCGNLANIQVDENNPVYCHAKGVLFNKAQTELIYCPEGNMVAYTVPDGVETIHPRAFYDGNVTSVAIPASVTEIGAEAFVSCSYLTQFEVAADNAVYSSRDGVLFNKAQTELLCFPMDSAMEQYIVPNGVTQIAALSFYNCWNLTDVMLPESVQQIQEKAFFGSQKLTCIQMAEGLISVGDSAFAYCSKLTSIKLPDSVTYLGSEAFYGCSQLAQVVLPKNLKRIENRTFDCCNSLTNITISSGVTYIGEYAFWLCRSLRSISIADSVIQIDSMAFGNCTALMDVYYTGTEAEWNVIDVYGLGNERLLNANIHFSDNTVIIGTFTGDVNNDGVINTTDAFYALMIYAKVSAGCVDDGFTDAQRNVADVNFDGVVDTIDAHKILIYYAIASSGEIPRWDII